MVETVEDASLKTVRAYYELAAEPNKRKLLCKDETCLQFLVYILDAKNLEVIKTSLKTLLLITEQMELRPYLSKVFGLQPALQVLVKTNNCIEIVVMSRKIRSRLFGGQSKPLKDIHNTSEDVQPLNNFPQKPAKKKAASVKAKILVFQIKGLFSHAHRKQCEEQMLKVKGLISITFSMSSSRFVVRARPEIKAEAIADAIARTEIMSAEQVLKNEDGEEVLMSFGKATEKSTIDKENSELPSYLSDEESPVKDKALTKSGYANGKSEGGWLSSAANFLSRSFYW